MLFVIHWAKANKMKYFTNFKNNIFFVFEYSKYIIIQKLRSVFFLLFFIILKEMNTFYYFK